MDKEDIIIDLLRHILEVLCKDFKWNNNGYRYSLGERMEKIREHEEFATNLERRSKDTTMKLQEPEFIKSMRDRHIENMRLTREDALIESLRVNRWYENVLIETPGGREDFRIDLVGKKSIRMWLINTWRLIVSEYSS